MPRAGLEVYHVGRTQEIDAILHDIEMIGRAGASFASWWRTSTGGKELPAPDHPKLRNGEGLSVVDADLSPERRFPGRRGRAYHL